MARSDQGVIFVPGTLPGELVEVWPVRKKKDYAVARLLGVIRPSPYRRDPFCPNHSAGCCHWQHIAYERQVEFKQAILRESLERLGRIRWDGNIQTITGPDRSYRLRGTFHVANRRLGFIQEGTHTVVPVRHCPALAPELNSFLERAAPILEGPEFRPLRLVRAITSGHVAATLEFERRPRMRWVELRDRLFEIDELALVIFKVGKRHVTFRKTSPVLNIGGLEYGLYPDAFFQGNRFLLSRLVTEAIRLAGAPRPLALDLYCGSGLFTLPLARTFRAVVGIEADPVAVREARNNTKRNMLNNVEFVGTTVANFLDNASVRPDVVLLNPPRQGAGLRNMDRIRALEPDCVVYLSCNPTTLAPEAARLVSNGYELTQLTFIDQFPHTYHIETACVLERARPTKT